MPTPKILPLTTLRFVAAFMVVIQHTVDIPARYYRWLWWGKFLNMGFAAVSFFFVLSGYILAVVYLHAGRPSSKARFWSARFARVYPLFFATLLLDAPDSLWRRALAMGWRVAITHTTISLAASALMLQAWVPKLGGINFPNWTLSVETVFYLAFPWIGPAIWRLGTRSTWWLAAALYLVGLLLVSVAIAVHLPYNVVKFDPIPHLFSFAIGIALARLHMQWLADPVVARRLLRWSPAMVAIAMLLLILLTQFSDRIPYLLLHDGLLAPPFCLLLIAFASGNHWMARTLSFSSLVLLGEASYGLYLLHIPLWHLLLDTHVTITHTVYVGYLGAAILLSILSFKFFETPARKWILSRLGRSKSRETELTSSLAQ